DNSRAARSSIVSAERAGPLWPFLAEARAGVRSMRWRPRSAMLPSMSWKKLVLISPPRILLCKPPGHHLGPSEKSGQRHSVVFLIGLVVLNVNSFVYKK